MNKKLVILLSAVFVVLLVGATTTDITSPNRWSDMIPGSTNVDLGSSAYRFGTVYATTVNATSISGTTAAPTTLTETKVVGTFSEVALTSPTVTFSADGKSYITLNSDANQTGITLTGGVTGQKVTIVSGDGSNTMRFDDNATTLALGSNVTLTEGQADVLTLLCTNGTSQTWTAVSAHDN